MADPNVETPEAEVAEAPPPSRRRWMLIAVIATVVLAAGGGAAWWFLAGSHAKGKAEAAAHSTAEPVYVALDPPFVVNFESNGLVRFLQVSVQVMSRDPATAELVKKHDPVIRNGLLMLFAGQDYKNLSTRPGKEKLRLAALNELRSIVKAEGGDADRIEAIYFTSFVMQ